MPTIGSITFLQMVAIPSLSDMRTEHKQKTYLSMPNASNGSHLALEIDALRWLSLWFKVAFSINYLQAYHEAWLKTQHAWFYTSLFSFLVNS